MTHKKTRFSAVHFSRTILTGLVVIFLTAPSISQAAPPAADPNTLKPATNDNDEAGTLPEKIDVQTMKKRYWTVGNEDQMDVVQNRLYTKKGRMEFSARYGTYSDDPFQTMNSLGFYLGYHFNEFWSLHGFYATVSSSNSAAYTTAESRPAGGFTPVVNPAQTLMGAEVRTSLIYGKLSLLGKSIIYYDLNIAAGVASQKNRSGTAMPILAGLGQQIYLNKTWFITTDYRITFHSDNFSEAASGKRSVTTSWVQIGVGVFAF